MCPRFRRCYVQASLELRHEDVSLLERCPHFRECYVQASMELGPEDASLLQCMKLDIKNVWTICLSTINFVLPFSAVDLP